MNGPFMIPSFVGLGVVGAGFRILQKIRKKTPRPRIPKKQSSAIAPETQPIQETPTHPSPPMPLTSAKRQKRQKRRSCVERRGGGNRKSGLHLLCGFLAHGHHRRKLVLCHQRSELLLVSRSTHSLRRGWVFGEGKGSR